MRNIVRTIRMNANLSSGNTGILALIAPLAIASVARAGAVEKPLNVVYVFADQWRAAAMGYASDPNVRTPHLDAFRRESIDFVNATTVSPVCSPARASMLTGRYPLSHGVFVNDVQLPAGELSIAEHFSRHGYHTGYIGKWHLDGRGRSAFIPPERRQGFGFWQAAECTHAYHHSPYYDNENPEKKYWEGYDAADQTEHAIAFIRENRNRPFMLWLSWGPPHSANQAAPEAFSRLFDPGKLVLRPNVPEKSADFAMKLGWYAGVDDNLEEARMFLAGYYSHIAALDSCFGKLREAIRLMGLDENTVIVFTSDHGDMQASHGLWNKQQPYDESVCVPFLVRVPGVEARREFFPVNTPDIMPTLCGLCDLPVPETVEGRDCSRLFKGESMTPEPSLIANYHPFGQCSWQRGGKEWRGIRSERYTYVRDLKGPWLLFDNQADPYQRQNLVSRPEYASVQREMDRILDRKLTETGDTFQDGMSYIRKWGYPVDETLTVPFEE
jgi:arylsulfatase A-like enzyme